MAQLVEWLTLGFDRLSTLTTISLLFIPVKGGKFLKGKGQALLTLVSPPLARCRLGMYLTHSRSCKCLLKRLMLLWWDLAMESMAQGLLLPWCQNWVSGQKVPSAIISGLVPIGSLLM